MHDLESHIDLPIDVVFHRIFFCCTYHTSQNTFVLNLVLQSAIFGKTAQYLYLACSCGPLRNETTLKEECRDRGCDCQVKEYDV